MSAQLDPGQGLPRGPPPPPDEEGPPAEAARLDAFISYTRRPDDTAFVDRLRDDLLARGKQVWLDRHRIEPAADWRQRIAQGITGAKALVFVVSPESLASAECAQELEIAAQQSKLIVPVILKDVDPRNCPEVLTKPNWIYYRATDDPAVALAHVVEALDADLEWRDTHARLGVRAQEWMTSGQEPSFLLRGQDLRQAESWYDQKGSHKQQPTDLQYLYIAAGRRAASKRQRAVTSGVALALVVALVLAVLAFVQRNAAVANQHVAESRQLAAEGTANLASDPDLSALFSLKALQVHYTSQAENSLRAAAPDLQLLKTFYAGSVVGAAAYSANGREAVTADENGTADIWDTATGALVRKLVEPPTGAFGSQNYSIGGNSIAAASFNPGDTEVVTASYDTTARIWDVATGHQVAVFGEDNELNDAVFSPNGDEVLVANEEGTADIWAIATHKVVREFTEPRHASINSAVFSGDGAVVLTASADGTARLWDVATGAQLATLSEPGHAAIEDAAFSPNSGEIVTASDDGTARIWDTYTRAQTLVLGLRSGNSLKTAKFSPNSRYIVTAGNGSAATVWDTLTGAQVTLLDEPQGGRMSGASFSPDSTHVLTSDNDGSTRIWDASPTQLALSVPEPGRAAMDSAAFNPSGTELVTASTDGTARVWDVATGKQLAVLDEGTGGNNFQYGGNAVLSVSFSPNGAEVVTASRDGTARTWDAATGKLVADLPANFVVQSAAFSPSGQVVVTANDDGQVDFWDAESAKLLRQFVATNNFLYSAALNPTGTEVVTSEADGTARVWDAKTGHELMVLHEPGANPIGTATFSPDGTRIVTVSDDGSARIWAVKSGKQLVVVHDPGGFKLYDAAFSPDGTKIVTASGSGEATLWDATTGKELTALGYAQGVRLYTASFSPNGEEVLTASYDGLASVWSATLAAPLAEIERVVVNRVDSAIPSSELQAEQRQVGG
jgi:WD40 repeat protein